LKPPSNLFPEGVKPTPAPTKTDAFLESSDPKAGVGSKKERADKLRRIQKRPLAADSFDEPLQPTAKRLFERQEIPDASNTNVDRHSSDSASEGEIMEIDNESQTGISSKPIASLSRPADSLVSNPAISQHHPSDIFDTSAKPNLSRAASATPNTVKDKATGNLWLEKSQEIEAMRRKIAEAEERQKLKRSQSQRESSWSSGRNTPVVTKAIPASALLSSPSTIESPKTQDAMAARAAALKAEVLRKRSLRRKALQAGLPDLDDEVRKTRSKLAETQAKLAQLRAETERREAESRAARQQEQEFLAEAMRLQEQLEQDLTGQKQYSEELQNIDSDPGSGLLIGDSASNEPEQPGQSIQNADVEQSLVEPVAADQQSANSMETLDYGPVPPADGPAAGEVTEEGCKPLSPNRHIPLPSENVTLCEEVMPTNFIPEAANDTSNSMLLTTTLPNAETASSSSKHDTVSDAHDHASENDSVQISKGSMDLDDESDGSASMSDSASEDYEPEDPQDHQIYAIEDDSDEYDPEETAISVPAPVLQADEDLDEYEPSETIILTTPIATEEVKVGTNEQVISVNGTSTQADGGEDGLQLTEAATLTNPQEVPKLVDDAVNSDVSPSSPLIRPLTRAGVYYAF
jgi:hypothetical protein